MENITVSPLELAEQIIAGRRLQRTDDLDFLIRLRYSKSGLVRVDCNKLNTGRTFADHSVDDIVTGAAHTDDFNGDHVVGTAFNHIRHI